MQNPRSISQISVTRHCSRLALLAALLVGCAQEPPSETSTTSEPTPSPPTTSKTNSPTEPPAPGTRGIDVSHFQGQIDWPSVAGSGVEFVFIKASEGIDDPDPELETNWQGAGDAGLLRGAYHFFEPADSGTEQASFFLSRIGERTLELGAVLDVEKSGELTPEELSTQIRAWLDAVQTATGRQPMIYTNADFWDDSVGSEAFSEYPLWIAEYEVEEPRLPMGWTSWAYWQDANNGSVPGISGDTDTDVAGPGPTS